MKVLIGTKNPGKIKGARTALEYFFKDVDIESVSAPSNVSEQPVNAETFIGAKNRVKNMMQFAKENNLDADLFIAVESGLVNYYDNWFITNFAVICDRLGHISVGTSASFPVPQKYVESIKTKTLAVVMDRIFNETDLRSSTGGIGLLTKENITRIDLNTQAFTMALTKFVNKCWKDDEELIK